MKKSLLFMIVFVVGVGTVFAQMDDEGNPNDPFTNDRANACFEGGTLEGRCHVDFDQNGTVDEFEIAWAWECGWHIIRYEAGIEPYYMLPLGCESFFPSPTLYECHTHISGLGSLLYIGPPNQIGNIILYVEANCSLSTLVERTFSSALIIADSLAEAEAICEAFPGDVLFLDTLGSVGYTSAPANYYGCTVFSTP